MGILLHLQSKDKSHPIQNVQERRVQQRTQMYGMWTRKKVQRLLKMGVPKGYKHKWKYKGAWSEKKVRKGLWRFRFRATKSHKGRRGEGNFGVGTKGAWKIKGIQYIRKISPNAYQTELIGTKTPMKFYVRKKKQNKRYRRRKYKQRY